MNLFCRLGLLLVVVLAVLGYPKQDILLLYLPTSVALVLTVFYQFVKRNTYRT